MEISSGIIVRSNFPGASNGQWEKIKQSNLEEFIPTVVVSGDINICKPDEAIFKETFKKLQVRS